MSWRERLPAVHGRLLFDEPLAPFTWLRVGGAAEVLFLPADWSDLTDFLLAVPDHIPRTVLGVGSNLIVRDGGIEGIVIRLAGRAFAEIHIDLEESRVIAGSGALDASVARAAADAGIAGLEFLAGIPGTIGGALTMNAGCYGCEIKDILVAASADDITGELRAFELEDFGYSYRASQVPPGIIWGQATFQGHVDDPAAIRARMVEITARREASQPIREKTGGSTFRNPVGDSAWRLVDAAGWRGKRLGGAMFSPQHANFLINTGTATAADLEGLAEVVRADVAAKFGVTLEWEINGSADRKELSGDGPRRLLRWRSSPAGRMSGAVRGLLIDLPPPLARLGIAWLASDPVLFWDDHRRKVANCAGQNREMKP